VLLIEPDVYRDERGFFLETWSAQRYAAHGLPPVFVQDNLSCSARGVLRGLHLQAAPHAQGKLVYVLEGEAFDVAVDLRRGSPTFGQWVGEILSLENGRQLYIPPGFAHGFCVTSERCLFAYKCTTPYQPGAEVGVAWNDPDLAIPWPVATPRLSPRDAAHPCLSEVLSRLPAFSSRPSD
jgi:dTDP-4-dehydrorhamnose 3,5-epimerase